MSDYRSPAGYQAHFADRRVTEEEALRRQREFERTGADPFGWHGPKTCRKAGHVPGCPGVAGGDHELLPGWIAIGDPDEGYTVEVEIAE